MVYILIPPCANTLLWFKGFERPSVPRALQGKGYRALSGWGKEAPVSSGGVEAFFLVMIEEPMELAKISFLYRVSGLRRSQKGCPGHLIRMSPGWLTGEGFSGSIPPE